MLLWINRRAQGDLFDDVKRRGGRVPEREVVQQVLYPYLTALAYLHARGIIHRCVAAFLGAKLGGELVPAA